MSAVRRFTLVFGVLLSITAIHPAAGIAQTCEALPVDGSPSSYRFRANVPRCEGMYRSLVVGELGMTLVALTFGAVTYDTKRDRYLEIKLPVKTAEKSLIQAVGVPERLYYRLDVELGPGQSVFRLPLGDVIASENIIPEALGIYAIRKLPGGQSAFLPVYARGSDEAVQTTIIAVVRPGSDVSDVQWRQYAPGAPATAWAPVAGASGLVPEGTRLEIVLGNNIPPQTTLEVSFLSHGVGRASKFVLLAN